LENFLTKDSNLKKAIEQGKTVAFADDLLLICDSVDETTTLIGAINGLTEGGLKLNKQKCFILSDHKDLVGK